ncbi:MAG: T9SS type A sorting domain-containing protein, partial [bacterium]
TTHKWTANYELPIAAQSGDVLAELLFNSMLGLSDTTTLSIEELTARGGSLTPVNGFFRGLGLCKTTDTTRLFNPFNKPAILSMNPNPTDGMINIEYETSEKGFTKMWVSDMLGNHVYELYSGVPNPCKADVNLDGTYLSDGVYFIILQTPTQIVREKIYIMR